METHIITTCTRDCPGCCGLVATVRDGRVTELKGNPDHPVTRGAACAKTRRYIDRVYSPERVLHPLRRVGHGWERVSWKDALDELAGRLTETIVAHGPEAVLHYQGFGERTALKLLNGRLFNLLGGVTELRGTLCGGTGYAAMAMDMGERVSHDPLDLLNSRTIVLWGRNPVATQPPLARIVAAAKKQGARVLLIDPVASESARLADTVIQPRPGRDAWLALAAAKAVLEAGEEDREFLERHCEGAEAFCRMVAGLDPGRLARAAGVTEAQIRLLATSMTRNAPAAVLLGWGLHRWKQGHLTIRAIDALAAVTGNIGRMGGGVSQGFEEYGPYDQSVRGDGLRPARRTLSMPGIGRELLEADPPVRLAVISAANPACMAPNADLVARGLDRIEFVAHMGHFLDDTSDHADLFLPCATFLEEDDVVAGYGHNYIGPVNKAVEPLGECRSQFDIYMDLASRFPLRDYVQDRETWLRRILRPVLNAGVDMGQVTGGPVRIPGAPMVAYENRVFPTPSGRFRLLTDPGDLPEAASEASWSPYPYHLLTVGGPEHLCSERTLADHPPLPEARLSSAEAARLGISDGSEILLTSGVGELRAKAVLDPTMRPDTVVCRRGGWNKAGHGVNRLVPDVASAVGEGTAYYEARVGIRTCCGGRTASATEPSASLRRRRAQSPDETPEPVR